MMSFTSYVLIMHRGTRGEALYAAATYLAVAVIGGLDDIDGNIYALSYDRNISI